MEMCTLFRCLFVSLLVCLFVVCFCVINLHVYYFGYIFIRISKILKPTLILPEAGKPFLGLSET